MAHRNSWFTQLIAWWIFPVRYVNVYQRVSRSLGFLIYGCHWNYGWSNHVQMSECFLQIWGVWAWYGNLWYPLVNVYIAMERSTIFNGKIHYIWSFSIAMLNYQRVRNKPTLGVQCWIWGKTPKGWKDHDDVDGHGVYLEYDCHHLPTTTTTTTVVD